jgi:L-fuconolactonase
MSKLVQRRSRSSYPLARRSFIACIPAGWSLSSQGDTGLSRIIDTHVHFYDPSRPGGVPWPPKDEKVLYRTVLPKDFRQLTASLGITDVIEVEASPLVEDNQWVLNLADKDPIITATVGNLEPDNPDFPKQLERFHRNPRFRGIRCGNLWQRSLRGQLSNPKFVDGLRLLARADLSLDSANPDPDLLATIVRVSDMVPELRIIIDHLPIDPPTEVSKRQQLDATYKELGARTQIYVKVSNVLRKTNGHVHDDLAYYRPAIDQVWDIFGSGRLLYGSNWPVSDRIAPYPVVFKVVHEYFGARGKQASEKYFSKNAIVAYRLK